MQAVISPKYPKYLVHFTKTNNMLPHSSPHICPSLAAATVHFPSAVTLLRSLREANQLGKPADTAGTQNKKYRVYCWPSRVIATSGVHQHKGEARNT